MMALTKKTKKNVKLTSYVILALSLLSYFKYRDSIDWVPLIMPEIIGISLVFLLFQYAMKNTTSFKESITAFSVVTGASLLGFIYGRANDIRFLVDLSPEILGVTALGLVLTLIFGKRTVI